MKTLQGYYTEESPPMHTHVSSGVASHPAEIKRFCNMLNISTLCWYW